LKYNGPKIRLSRKLGITLTPKAQKYLEKKPYGPGMHGMKRRRRLTNYGRQLLEKQRLRFQYNISERQLRNYYKDANAMKGVTGENLIRLLETRLDALVLRAGFARTIFAARQFVSHGHILVNGKRLDIPSASLREGDVFEIKEKSRKVRAFNEGRGVATVPGYLEIDSSGYGAKLGYLPRREEVPVICEEQLIVEFYSR
jgi:small subunit ribosomal protein S4